MGRVSRLDAIDAVKIGQVRGEVLRPTSNPNLKENTRGVGVGFRLECGISLEVRIGFRFRKSVQVPKGYRIP